MICRKHILSRTSQINFWKQGGSVMGNNRSKVPDLEKLVKGGRKKFVRYEEGAMFYSMGIHTFQQLQ